VALETRCELLLRAQTQYVQAIRVGNAEWAAASAYRIGQLYSGLYSDIVDVPVPDPDVPSDIREPEELEAFRDEYPRHYRRLLRAYLEPLLRNAIRWWETNLMMTERTGLGGEWVGRTQADLQRIRDLLDADAEDGAEEGGGEPNSAPAGGEQPPDPVWEQRDPGGLG
jgi:hypothetical protein